MQLHRLIVFLLLFLLLSIRAICSQIIVENGVSIIDHKQRAYYERGKQSWIYFSMRMPPGWTIGNPATGPDKVRGVFCVLRWYREPNSVHDLVSKESQWTQFADKHRLALLSWTSLGFYTTGISNDEMDKKTDNRWSERFDEAAGEWEKGIRHLIREYGIPERDYLVQGHSGGGQTGHRLALRKPQYFSAIHIHVNSSYDKPVPAARNIIWLVSTGEREYGYPASQRFYYDALEAGYSIIYKAGESLGHSSSPQIDRLGLAFFEYALTYLPDYREKAPIGKGNMHALLRKPPFIGDWLNQDVVPAAKSYLVQGRYQTAIPTRDIAKIWGTLIEE
jgi:pimeloyl-ACP methyl ester carboxylesterase